VLLLRGATHLRRLRRLSHFRGSFQCFYLQRKEWLKAVEPLVSARDEIKKQARWKERVDSLCIEQRNALNSDENHDEFARFWYNLTLSKEATSYYIQRQTEEVRKKLVDKKITSSCALSELCAIKKIDPKNEFVNQLIDAVEFEDQMQPIRDLVNSGKFAEGVTLALNSQHKQVRFVIAEMCVSIVLESIQKRNNSQETIRQLGLWAYQLCPYEPEFYELYRAMGLR
jgi:hypothetical protein